MHQQSQNRISAINSPHELALGIACGVVVGIMPKDSVFPWLFALFFMLGRGNLLCGIIAAFVMSLVGPMLDVFSDRMGMSILSISSMQSTFASWMEIPWVAWTRFNNTVVAGSMGIGVLSFVPVYLLSQIFFRVWGIDMIHRVMNMRVIRFLFGESSESNATSESVEPSFITET